MSPINAPLILEPDELESLLGTSGLIVIDLCKPKTFGDTHIPGAIHIDYENIIRTEKPVMGLLPVAENLSRVLSAAGIWPEAHVVAYDDEGGGQAARLLWTLDCAGHKNLSLLNGGLN